MPERAVSLPTCRFRRILVIAGVIAAGLSLLLPAAAREGGSRAGSRPEPKGSGTVAATPAPAPAPVLEPEARIAGATALGYLVTGDAGHDQLTRAGLEGLASVLRQRTAVEAIQVVGVDAARDELALLPLLYWAPAADGPPLGADGAARLNRFLVDGGVLVLDHGRVRAGRAASGGPPRLPAGLTASPLVRLAGDHVLTRSFYLLQEFPGRFRGGAVWIADGGPGLDGVAPLLAGQADWAAAWAVDREGRPLHAAIPGGETQRELAYRFGVNLVMYALTGNYKADQVHVRTILERLGR